MWIRWIRIRIRNTATNYASSSTAMLRRIYFNLLHAYILFAKLGCKGGSGAMEESGLMGGGQGDGPADSHPTSGLSLFKG